LYPTRCAFPRPEPMDENVIEGFSDPITLYYRALIICGFSRCKGWQKHRRVDVEINYYENDGIPNIEGELPPTVKKYPIGSVEPTRCVEHLKENFKVRILEYVNSSNEDRAK